MARQQYEKIKVFKIESVELISTITDTAILLYKYGKQNMLDDSQKHWDNTTLEYDLTKYNFREWVHAVIREKFPQVEELEKIHEVLEPNQVVRLQQHVQNACSRKVFMEMFDAFALSLIHI